MKAVSRTRGIRKVIRGIVTGEPVPKYVTAGSLSCQKMMTEARCPSDQAILAWARYDLTREIMSGFWEYHAA